MEARNARMPLLRACDPDRTTHAGSPEPAITRRVLCEILLVVVLGVIEHGRRGNLSSDFAVVSRTQLGLEHRTRRLNGLRLCRVKGVDDRPVLRPYVVALA